MVSGEGLGVRHQLPALVPQLVHQAHQRDLSLGMAAGDELLLIQPKLLDLPSPALAARHEPQLGVFPLHRSAHQSAEIIGALSQPESVHHRDVPMKEVSLLEMIGRSLAKVAAGAGVAALLLWLTYVMLDVGHMQSGFTLPESSY